MKKKVLFMIVGALMPLSFLFVSCSDDDDDAKNKPEKENVDGYYYKSHCKDIQLIGEGSSGFNADSYNKTSLNEAETQVVDGINDFSFRLFKKLEGSDVKKNIFVSPFSIQQVLAMVGNGADDSALAEIYATLGYDGSQANYNAANRVLLNMVKKSDDSGKLEIANAAWIDYKLPVFKAFSSDIQNFYDSDIMGLDVMASDAGKIVNSWCADKTHDMIPSIVDDGPLSGRLLLANAVYFKAMWSSQFSSEKTTKQRFYNTNGTSSDVDMMRWNKPETAMYASMEKMDAVSLPFVSGYEMMVFLPKDKAGLAACINSMDFATWNTSLSMLNPMPVDVIMPKFKIKDDMNLISILKSMGIKKLFTDDGCLSRLSTMPLIASEFAQKSVINVDEKGTEAAALTYLIERNALPETNPKPVEFKVDHPFMYVIYDTKTRTIIFTGCVKEL